MRKRILLMILTAFAFVSGCTIVLNLFFDLSTYNQMFIKIIPINLYIVILTTLNYCIAVYLFNIFNIKKQYTMNFLVGFYVLFMVLTLYMRPNYQRYQYVDGQYIIAWWRLIFVNRIVFINIVGNIVIYIPLGIITRYYCQKWQFIINIIIIVFLELLQYVTKTGVFDISDIMLNYLGASIGIVISYKATRSNRNGKFST